MQKTQLHPAVQSVVDGWLSLKPAFLWAPSRAGLLVDRVSGAVGRVAGSVPAAPGGLITVTPNSSTSWIEFATNAGVSATGQSFYGVALVSVVDPSAVTGSFFKLGGDGDGYGFGGGNTTQDDIGSNLIPLVENIAWGSSGGSFASGLNAIFFGYSSDSNIRQYNLTTGTAVAKYVGTPAIAASQKIRINGYMPGRGSNMKTHAVAIFNPTTSGTQFDDLSVLPQFQARHLWRMPRSAVDQLFNPRRHIFPVVLAASAVPSITAVYGDSVTVSSVTPRVTLDFA